MSGLREFNFFTDEIIANPFDVYRDAIENSPIIKIPGKNTFVVFGRELVEEALKRFDDFSNNTSVIMQGPRRNDPEISAILSKGWPFIDTLATCDPPVHGHYRALVNTAFTRGRAERMSDEIRTICQRLIRNYVADGECEFVEAFAKPLPIEIIAGQLGLQRFDQATIRRWTEAISERLGGMLTRERELECARDIVEFQHAMVELIEERRGSDRDDLLGGLVNARVKGERPLNEGELLSVLYQVVAAGNFTTTCMLGNGMSLLIANPQFQPWMRENPDQIPKAVEEMLRMEGAAQGVWRLVTKDCTLGGVALPEGAHVQLRVGAANRDPARFEDPHAFDPTKKRDPHLSFGRGVHACIGAMLARRELTIAFEELMSSMAEIRLAEGTVINYPISMHSRLLSKLPITFTPIRVFA